MMMLMSMMVMSMMVTSMMVMMMMVMMPVVALNGDSAHFTSSRLNFCLVIV